MEKHRVRGVFRDGEGNITEGKKGKEREITLMILKSHRESFFYEILVTEGPSDTQQLLTLLLVTSQN